MHKNKNIFIISHIVRRFISSNNTMYKNYAIRQSKIMNKFLKQNESKRKWYKNNPPAELDFHSSLLKEKKPSVHAQRRMVVLNKLFMKNITDLMSTCEAASELSERGVEITNVSISSDYKSLNVYWTLEKVDDDKNWPTTIEEVLQKNSYMLRHELSQMHIISNVPIICFVKDKIISNAREVESRLASLDLDQDYIESKEKTKQLDITNDNETDQSDNSFQITLPEMRHDVLGLDHHRIMSKVKSFKNKSKNHINNKDVLESYSELKGQPLSAFLNNEDISKGKNQRELFIEFLKKRKIEERKKYRLRNRHLEPHVQNTYNDDNDDVDDNESYFDQDFDNVKYDNINDEFEK